ncbi:MAG: hypothetical protein ACI8PT_004710, partial [Gammaproteobacteria bacterium]
SVTRIGTSLALQGVTILGLLAHPTYIYVYLGLFAASVERA